MPVSRLTEGLAAAGKLGASVPAGFSLDGPTELPSKPPGARSTGQPTAWQA